MIINFNESIYLYEEYKRDCKRLAKKYRNKIKYITIGKSHDSRDIILMKVGSGKSKVIITSGVHGRESINIIVLMKIVEDLTIESINKKTDVLNQYTLYIIPLLNPDGYMIASSGYDIIQDDKLRRLCKSANIPYPEWKYNARGVDINRNFPSMLWKALDIFDYVASENETKALIKLFKRQRAMAYFDIHSRGKEIYYYRNVMTNEYNVRQKVIADRMKECLGYKLVEPENEINKNDRGGNTVHYFSEKFKKPAITIETIDNGEEFPLDISLRNEVYEELMKFFCRVDFILNNESNT